MSVHAEEVDLSGNSIGNYSLITKSVGDVNYSYVYENGILVSESSLNLNTGQLYAYDYVNNIRYDERLDFTVQENNINFFDSDDLIAPMRGVNYRLVSSDRGSLKFAAMAVATIIGIIAAFVPGASHRALLHLAETIVNSGGDNFTYSLDLYTATQGKFFYAKRAFKIYNTSGQQVGPTVTGYTKTRK